MVIAGVWHFPSFANSLWLIKLRDYFIYTLIEKTIYFIYKKRHKLFWAKYQYFLCIKIYIWTPENQNSTNHKISNIHKRIAYIRWKASFAMILPSHMMSTFMNGNIVIFNWSRWWIGAEWPRLSSIGLRWINYLWPSYDIWCHTSCSSASVKIQINAWHQTNWLIDKWASGLLGTNLKSFQ